MALAALAGAAGIGSFFGETKKPLLQGFDRSAKCLYYTVREPYPSTSTGAEIVFGKIDNSNPLTVTSYMPENGIIFSDGVEEDFLQFNSGAVAKISLSEKQGRLVV